MREREREKVHRTYKDSDVNHVSCSVGTGQVCRIMSSPTSHFMKTMTHTLGNLFQIAARIRQEGSHRTRDASLKNAGRATSPIFFSFRFLAQSRQVSPNLAQPRPVSPSLIQSHPVSSTIIQSHPVSSSFIQPHPASLNLIHSRPVSSRLIQFHPVS